MRVEFFYFYRGTKGTEDYRGAGSLLGIQRTKKSGFLGSKKRHEAGEDEYLCWGNEWIIGARREMEQAKEKMAIWFGGGI